jgi:ABC-type multidrug transport system permease subunit
MMNIPDGIGQVLWFAMFFTPAITIPVLWRNKSIGVVARITLAILLALCISFFLFLITMAIALRNGLGPT